MRMLTRSRTDYCSQAKHANGEHSWGVDGETGKAVDMKGYGLYESSTVKVRSLLLLGPSRRLTHPLLDPNSQDRNRSEHCDGRCEILIADLLYSRLRASSYEWTTSCRQHAKRRALVLENRRLRLRR